MPSASVLAIDELLAPIPGDNPAGDTVPFTLRQRFEEDRKEIDPDQFAPDDPRRPAEPKRADWAGIARLARDTLGTTSKDLLVAARLTEALVKQHDFVGLADGLQRLRRLVDECWDRVNPAIEDGDLEVRAAPFNWLGDADRGARFPHALRSVPLIVGEGAAYSWQEWRLSQAGRGTVSRDDFDKAVQATPREYSQTVVEDLLRSKEELDALVVTLNQRLGAAAPGLTDLRQAVEECLVLARQILERKGPAPATVGEAPAAETAETAPAGAAPAEADGKTAVVRAMASRADVYRRLVEAADVLQQLEPHSPIPYLIRKAVELGGLPFPLLMKALIREENVLHEMNRELGIKEEPPPEG